MNPFEFVIAIVAIVTIGNIIRVKQMGRYGMRGMGRRHPFGMFPFNRQSDDEGDEVRDTAETRRLREEVQQLKERLKVLERITVEKENSLAKEIESLRDR